MDSRALTEEHPRTAAQLAADALDVCEEAGTENDDAVGRLAFQVQRLARQVAELAQLADDPSAMLPEERADAEAEQRAIDAEYRRLPAGHMVATVEVAHSRPRRHCEHDDGHVSWAISESPVTAYLHGTPDELRTFARKLLTLADEVTR